MKQTEKPMATARIPEIDLAYRILKEKKEPVHYKPLIEEILTLKQSRPEEGLQRAIASILTQINLDNRFFHQGKGLWGLREWAPKHKIQRVPLLTPLNKRQRDAVDDPDSEEENELETGFIINSFDYDDSDEEEYEE